MVQGASSSFPPRREQGLEGTRSLLSSRLQREHEGADPIPARPSACLWLGHRESSFVAGGSDRSPESDRPLPAVPRSSVFRSPLHATPQCVAECGFQIGDEVTQHLSSSLMAPVGVETPCEQHRHHARPKDSCYERFREEPPAPPARGALHRVAGRQCAPDRQGIRTLLREAEGAEPVRARCPLAWNAFSTPKTVCPTRRERPRSSVGRGRPPFTRPQHPRDSTSAM